MFCQDMSTTAASKHLLLEKNNQKQKKLTGERRLVQRPQ
jgi:hypothetical protein